MDIELRLEDEKDYRETENMIREAFWNRYVPGCDEHYLMSVMRGKPDFLHELDFVAVHEGRIVGNIACAKGRIRCDDGQEIEVVSLGPIAVLPEYQAKGIGRQLIERVCYVAGELGYSAIFLCGDPEYYSKQGFVPAEGLGIRTAENMYAVALQLRELKLNALLGARGRYYESEIYQVNPKSAAEFDESFPNKEKLSDTPSQKRFLKIVAMQKKYELMM